VNDGLREVRGLAGGVAALVATPMGTGGPMGYGAPTTGSTGEGRTVLGGILGGIGRVPCASGLCGGGVCCWEGAMMKLRTSLTWALRKFHSIYLGESVDREPRDAQRERLHADLV